MKKIKILMVLGNLNICDGISAYAMNYYNNMDFNLIQMDFAVVKDNIDPLYRKQIEAKGGKIYELQTNSLKELLSNRSKIIEIFKNNNYDIIHSHVINMGYIFIDIAKKYGIKYRIIHSHTELPREKNLYRKVRNKILIKLLNNVSNIRFACSDIAGKSLFGNNKYIIIRNAIDLKKYSFDSVIRKRLRKEYSIDDKFVIGHVGRFCHQKNQEFILNTFEKINKKSNNTVLVLIGDGPDFQKIKEESKIKKLEKNIIFMGSRSDVPKLLNMFDVFILPSNYEGLPIVSVEAQANGLTTFISDKVSFEAKILESTEYLPLDENIWIEKLLNCKIDNKRINDISKFHQSDFNIEKEGKKLQQLYKLIVSDKIDDIDKILNNN